MIDYVRSRKDYKTRKSLRDYVYPIGNGKYQIVKGRVYFGRYKSREDAKKVSEELRKIGWDKEGLKKAQKKANVRPSDHYSRNTTGYARVMKQKDNRVKRGFSYVYSYKVDGKEKRVYGKTLKELEKKVKEQGLRWEKL